MKLYLSTILILIFTFSALAQTENKSLTNQDVIELSSTGLSAEIIAAKIRASATNFDTSTQALEKLSDAKVPDAVIIAMIDADKAARTNANTANQRSDDSKNSVPEQGTLTDLKGAKLVYIATANPKSRDFIIKELQKDKRFEVVDKIENADFVMRYEEAVENVGVAATVNGNTGSATNLTQNVGNLTVVMPSAQANRVRLLYSTRKTEYRIWEENPAKSTTKQFLKDLDKTVGAKK